MLYDDENCEGWSHKVPYESYPAYDLPKDNRNDAEVVVVRSGCKFTGMIIDLQCTSFLSILNSFLLPPDSLLDSRMELIFDQVALPVLISRYLGFYRLWPRSGEGKGYLLRWVQEWLQRHIL